MTIAPDIHLDRAATQRTPRMIGRTVERVRRHLADMRVEFLVRVPSETPQAARVCITGNHARLGQWKPDGLQLARVAEREYHGQVDLPRGETIDYKVTCGNWATVEQTVDGDEQPNRRLFVDGGALQLITVDRWANLPGMEWSAPAMAQGTVHVLRGFRSSILNNSRTIRVYVPAGYQAAGVQRYPVLYLQDGQNLFDPVTAYRGVDWRANRTADQLIARGAIDPLIIVGIDNTPDRLNEYAPLLDRQHGAGGRADEYTDFIVDELKPYIDRLYRTNPGRRATAIGGSSLGAVAALHACKRHPTAFSKCAAISPSLWWAGHGLTAHFIRQTSWLNSLRLWIDMGTEEGCAEGEARGHAVASARQFARRLAVASGDASFECRFAEIEGGEHNEQSWAARFDRVLRHLFGDVELRERLRA